MAPAPTTAESSEAALHRWAVTACGASFFAAFFALRTAELYVVPLLVPLAGTAAGFGVAHRRRHAPEDTSFYFLAASFACAITSVGSFLAFGTPFVALAGLFAVAFFTSAALAHAAWTQFRWAWAMDFVSYAVHPLRWLAAGAVTFVLAWLGARGGHLRSGLGVAACLVIVAAAHPRAYAFLEGRVHPRRRTILAWVVLALGGVVTGFALAERWVPLAELDVYVGEIVHARDGESHRYVVVAAPAGYELFEDMALIASPLDDSAFASALTKPLLHTAVPPRRGLLLFGGCGALELALLTAPLDALTVVVADPELPRVASGLPALAALAPALQHPRTRVVVAEPYPWLASQRDTYDVIVANLPPPMDHRAGKYYTLHFFQLLAAHLSEHGAVAFPATSALTSRDAFEDVLATAEAAGLHVQAHHVSLPALGVASVVVGTSSASANIRGLAAATLAEDLGRDLDPTHTGHVARLHDQRVVGAFVEPRAQLPPK